MDSANHLLPLNEEHEITRKQDVTARTTYVKTCLPGKKQVYRMAYYSRDWQSQHPDAKGIREELLVLQEILPDDEKASEIIYVRRYPLGQ